MQLNIGLLMLLDVNVMYHFIKMLNNVSNASLDALNVLMETHVKLVIKLVILLISMAHVIVLMDTILMVEPVFHVLIV